MELEGSTVSLRRKQYELALRLWDEGKSEEQIYAEYQKQNIKTNKSLSGFKIQINKMRKEFGWFSRDRILNDVPIKKVRGSVVNPISIVSGIRTRTIHFTIEERATLKLRLKEDLLKGMSPLDLRELDFWKNRLSVGSIYNLVRELIAEFPEVKEILAKSGFDSKEERDKVNAEKRKAREDVSRLKEEAKAPFKNGEMFKFYGTEFTAEVVVSILNSSSSLDEAAKKFGHKNRGGDGFLNKKLHTSANSLVREAAKNCVDRGRIQRNMKNLLSK